MKSLFLIVSFFALAACGNAQKKDSANTPAPTYLRFPTVPPFKLILPSDNTSLYTKADLPKNKAVMMMIFSPDCEHCQHEIEEIIKNIADFKNIQIVMATMLPIEKVREFVTKYDLKRFSNIVVGKDQAYMLPSYYNIHNLPFLAFYNKKQNLISVFEGNLGVPKILKEFQK
jgi:thioredoxin-related protein